MKKFIILIFIVCVTFVYSSCSTSRGPDKNEYYENVNIEGESYKEINESPFINTSDENDVYFTMDSNTGSYANLRRYINNGQDINGNIIKTDELINYFSYNFSDPEEGETFNITSDLMVCPWNEENHLITLGVSTKKVELDENIRNNLVFLIDVSGSMTASNKLPLIKEAFPLMLDHLNPTDIISIVTYSSKVKVVLEATQVVEKDKIIEALEKLSPSGGTNGNSGLLKAYEVAESTFIEGGNNRIILATDGDFNIGPSSDDEMKALVTERKESGVYLSVLGLGMGNYQDSKVETLAMNGNGNYAYIDSLIEAEKVLTEDLKTTLLVIAKDVKVNVKFNSEVIEQYRVIGYENKQLTEDDFNNDKKDASELGSGSTTVVTYEVKLKDGVLLESENLNILTTTINYKSPENNESKTYTESFNIKDISEVKSEDFIFVACLVEFSLILRNSEYKNRASLNEVLDTLQQLQSIETDVYREEFVELVKKVIEYELITEETLD